MFAAPLAPVPAVASPGLQSTGGMPDIQVADRMPAPAAHDSAEFARAAAQATSGQGAPLDVPASLPPSSTGVGANLMQQLEQLTRHLGSLQGAPPAGGGAQAEPGGAASNAAAPPLSDPQATGPHAVGFDRASMDGAVAQIEHAYTFAIETTMASRGSTESTKIFNTLLKGQ